MDPIAPLPGMRPRVAVDESLSGNDPGLRMIRQRFGIDFRRDQGDPIAPSVFLVVEEAAVASAPAAGPAPNPVVGRPARSAGGARRAPSPVVGRPARSAGGARRAPNPVVGRT